MKKLILPLLALITIAGCSNSERSTMLARQSDLSVELIEQSNKSVNRTFLRIKNKSDHPRRVSCNLVMKAVASEHQTLRPIAINLYPRGEVTLEMDVEKPELMRIVGLVNLSVS